MEVSNNYNNYNDILETEEVRDTTTFLMVKVNGLDFALDFSQIREIISAPPITQIPEFPKYVCGVCNVNEKLVPVINSRVRFGYEDAPMTDRSCVVVVRVDDKEAGLLVDSVSKFRETFVDTIKPPPEVNGEAVTRYITGMFKRTNGDICFIVNASFMLSDEEKSRVFSDKVN